MKSFITLLWHFCSQHDFLVSFWSGLLSSIIVAILLTGWAYLFTSLFDKPAPNLTMVVKQDGIYSSVIKFVKQDDGSHTADFQLAIKNEGNLTLKKEEGFWHTYVTTDASVTILTAPGELNHQRGVISYPIYPKYIVDIDNTQYHLVIAQGETPKDGIPYFFATDYGFFPKNTDFDQRTGQINPNKIGLIKFEMPQK